MMAAFLAWIGLTQLGPWLGQPDLQVNFWLALVLAPALVAVFGMAIERTLLRRLYHLDHLYGLLLTFGVALVMEAASATPSACRARATSRRKSSRARSMSASCCCRSNRVFVVVASLLICFATWYLFERTKLGAYLRAGTENPRLLQPSASTCR